MKLLLRRLNIAPKRRGFSSICATPKPRIQLRASESHPKRDVCKDFGNKADRRKDRRDAQYLVGGAIFLKTISCLIIIASLFYYNRMMELNHELTEANEAMLEMSVKAQQALEASSSAAGGAEPVSEPQGKYKDGTYSGTAKGYGGPVTTQLTIENGYIVGIEVTSSDGEDAPYYNMCLGILDEIVEEQSSDVDTVSGATLTAKGIIGGAKKALAKAVKE
jgi:uncharacterized protein with FMN-binding domain